MCCIDCLNFKMKKGWKYARCIKNMITLSDGDVDRNFKVINKAGQSLKARAGKISVLNKECPVFDDMGEV